MKALTMKKLACVFACLALLIPAARAVTVVEPAQQVTLGYCQLSVTTAVLVSTCSGGIPAGATLAYIITETAAIRWRDDGPAPTTTAGNPLATGVQLTFMGNLTTLQVVAQTGTASVSIGFYRY